MKVNDLKRKVQLLKAGQPVEIDGLIFTAKRRPLDCHEYPCSLCNVDCLCKGDVATICADLDWMSQYRWYLNLES